MHASCSRRFPVNKGLPTVAAISRGFTLIEVQIALVITSLLVAVLVSSLYYVFRVQDLLGNEVVDREAALRVKAWFSEALEACLPAPKDSASAFVGNSREIRCETLAPLEPRRIPVPLRIMFALRPEEGGNTGLAYSEQVREQVKTHTLSTWRGADIHFVFIDSKGKQLDQWPPSQVDIKEDRSALPALIRLVFKSAGGIVSDEWLVAPRADGWLPPPPQNPFGIKLP